MLCAYLNRLKTEQGLTSQQLSDMSGVPKSTIDRILRDESVSPTIDTAAALVRALGGSLDEAMDIEPTAPDLPADRVENTEENLRLVHGILNRWWGVVATINHEKNAAYAASLKARDRWLTFSVAVNCVFIGWLIYDLLHPTRGWIQYDQASAYIQQGMARAVSVCSLWFSRT